MILENTIKTNWNGILSKLLQFGDHSKIEHDISLTRKDIYLGSNILFDHKRYKKLKKLSVDGKYITMQQLAKHRENMRIESIKKNPTLTYGFKQMIAASSESAVLLILLCDHTGNIRLDWLDEFLIKERFPFTPVKI